MSVAIKLQKYEVTPYVTIRGKLLNMRLTMPLNNSPNLYINGFLCHNERQNKIYIWPPMSLKVTKYIKKRFPMSQ